MFIYQNSELALLNGLPAWILLSPNLESCKKKISKGTFSQIHIQNIRPYNKICLGPLKEEQLGWVIFLLSHILLWPEMSG